MTKKFWMIDADMLIDYLRGYPDASTLHEAKKNDLSILGCFCIYNVLHLIGKHLERIMAKTAIINARIEPELKKAGNEVLATIGLTPSAAISLLYKAIVRDQGLPLNLHIPNEDTARALQSTEYYEFENEADVERWLSGDDDLEDFALKAVSVRHAKNEAKGKIAPKRKKSDRASQKRKTTSS